MIPKTFFFPLVIVPIMIICVAWVLAFPVEKGIHPALIIQFGVICIGIPIQVVWSLRNFNKCIFCGHSRHQHDKKELIRRGFGSLCRVICDDFRKGDGGTVNYVSKYSDGKEDKWWEREK